MWQRIYVRGWTRRVLRNKLRITVGTPEENEQLMKALRFIAGLKQTPQNDLSRYNGRLKGGNNIQRLAQFGALPAAPSAPVAVTFTIVGINSMQLLPNADESLRDAH
jgi:hypothetical protein